MSDGRNGSKEIFSKTALYFILIILLAGILLPFYWMIKTSLESNISLFKFPPSFFTPKPNWSSYVDIFIERPLLQWFQNSLKVSLIVTFFSMIVSGFSAYSLSRFPTRLNKTVGFIILTTQMFPGTFLLLPIYMIFRSLGLVDTHTGITVAYITFTLPVCIWMLKGYFDSVPVEIEESAIIDGCSRMGILFRMTLPLSLAGIAATSIYAFIQAWDEFMFVFLLISSDSKWLLSNGLFSLIGEYLTPWNWLMAIGTVYTLPAVVLFLFLQRYLVSGVTSGAVKG